MGKMFTVSRCGLQVSVTVAMVPVAGYRFAVLQFQFCSDPGCYYCGIGIFNLQQATVLKTRKAPVLTGAFQRKK